ncbi:acyl-CoA thioesterase [Streptomyces sp. NPDC093249]|uniref:acyl-CoA thioesterase n=1 Tax=unclassified Streptomyces TaxID=2593676 RepID=UPI00344BEA05
MTYTCRLPLRWSDLDAYGHVNNAAFLTYVEEARTRMVRDMLPADETERRRHAFVVKQSLVDYKASLTYREDPISVDVWVTASRGARLELGYAVRDETVTYAEATTKLAAYDLEAQALRRMTEDELTFLARYARS